MNAKCLFAGFIFFANVLFAQFEDYTIFENGDLILPIDNRGSVGLVEFGNDAYTEFKNTLILYSAGFYLSGYTNGNLWSNSVFYTHRFKDYEPGLSGGDKYDPRNKIYVVESSDPFFGGSWQEWKYAVDLGANFYDGNSDGVYNPVDLNNNGTWDISEDRPDLIGDYTAWCTYNDGKPAEERKFGSVDPQGIQIKQTLFASRPYRDQRFGNLFFLRYEIENTGTLTETIDSVYFGFVADPDLGNPYDDMIGCDTVLDAGYSYQVEEDAAFGNETPCFLVDLLQGPQVFIPGVTYNDVNGNNVYDASDIPLDSASVKNGTFLGERIIPGATTLEMTSFIGGLTSYSGFDDPHSSQGIRNYLLGARFEDGRPIRVGSFAFGNGSTLGADTNNISPYYLFSGDPETESGWLCTYRYDWRMLVSTGPFELAAGKPVVILYAVNIGQGTSNLESVSIAKNDNQFAQQVYENNFNDLIVSVDETEINASDSFQSFGTYPNPFNGQCTLEFSLPSRQFVKISVYDILGRKVKDIAENYFEHGEHRINLNLNNYSTGVYLLGLLQRGKTTTHKLLLVK